jgi:aspartyl protease family protein
MNFNLRGLSLALMCAVLANASPLARAEVLYSDRLPALGKLGLDLPLEVVEKKDVWDSLDELSREPCDKTAIEKLGAALEKSGRRRDAANALVAFSDACGQHANSLRSAANILLRLSDYRAAEAVSTKLIALEPYSDNGYYLRGLARFEAKDYVFAIADFISAIELFGEKEHISSSAYIKIAKSFEALDRPCDAIGAIETWVAIDPDRNDTSQTRAIIASLQEKGRCERGQAKQERFPIARKGQLVVVTVEVNGVKGRFVLDTGATYVALTREFAGRAGVKTEEGGTITLQTANGFAQARLARARDVALKSLRAHDVPVVVMSNDSALKPSDGLLGMSFLARFQLQMDGQSVTVRQRS